MYKYISFEELLPFGVTEDGFIKIKESFRIEKGRGEVSECVIVRLYSLYEGEEKPKISFDITVDGQSRTLYDSPIYNASTSFQLTVKEWRIPPMLTPDMKMHIKVDIPEGTTLLVRDFYAYESSGADYVYGTGIRHNAHLGFWGMAPDNTMPAFELAHLAGFKSCIVVPKVTKDGVLVCIHDDTINKTARDKDGKAPEEPMAVGDMTYAELLEWDVGRYKNPIYKGTKIPKLEEFFDFCMKTGMRPMFSTHPGLSREKWLDVKEMLSRRGLLSSFHVKSFEQRILARAYSVFGTEIDGYTFDCNTLNDELIAGLLSIGIDNTKCRLVYEHPFNYYTEEGAKKILDAGLSASAYSVKVRSADEYERLIRWGVTEFTEDNHCSMGLNW